MKAEIIRTKRAALSIGERLEELSAQHGRDSPGALADAVVNFGLLLASDKVANGLRNSGLGLADGTVSAESIRAALSAKIGAEVLDLSPEGIAAALNARVSNEVAQLLGIEGIDLLHGGDIQTQARALAIAAIASGRPSKLVNAAMMRELRTAAAYEAAGLSVDNKAKALNRARQRRYRLTSKQVWV